MATCRLCKGQYPADQFIDGNGPRHLVCVRCAVEEGYLAAEEVPYLFDERTAMARMSLFVVPYYALAFFKPCQSVAFAAPTSSAVHGGMASNRLASLLHIPILLQLY